MFNFTVKEFILGNGNATPTLQFYKRGFNLSGNGEPPSWQDIILSGNTALTLTNALANSLNYLKLFGGTEQRNIPSGYTQVEYLQSDDEQWIDTGFIPNNGMILDAKAQVINKQMIIGSIDTYADASRNLVSYSINGYSPQKLNNYNNKYTDSGINPAIIHLDTTGTKFYCIINNNEVINTTTGTLTNQTVTVKLSYSDYSDSARSGRYYYVKIYNSNGELARDLIPARRNSDNVLGMYDTVTGNFLTNAGTGTFTAGADVVPSPDTLMDIVCNNGVVKVNRNLYSTEYHDKVLSQSDGVTTTTNTGVNVSRKVDCRTIKSFKITTVSPQGAFRIFKYGIDNTFINANSTASIGDIITLEDNVGFFRIQYNFTNSGTGTQNILIYNSAYNLNGIYTDGTTETVEITGKNLFDSSGFNTDVGQNISWLHYQIPNGTYTMSTNFPPQPGQLYTNVWILAGNVTSGQDSTMNGVSLGHPKTITVTDGWYSVAYRSGIPVIPRNPKDYNWQLELGSTATAYEPYTVFGTATAENLFAIGNNYKDVQEVLAGNVTRNIGIKVLDGTEDWAYNNSAFLMDLIDRLPQKNFMFCTHFNYDGGSSTTIPNLCIGCGSTTNTIFIKYQTYNTVEQFKSWLADQYSAGTPVIVVYPLATATTETVTGQELTTQAGTNIVEITQASIDNLGLEVSYKATV